MGGQTGRKDYMSTNRLKPSGMTKISVGRPVLYDKPMKQTAIWMTTEMIEWLKSQPGSMSDQMRAMIEEKMKHE